MSISYNGYKNNTLTMENYNAKVGYPVTVDSDGEAAIAIDGKPFIGICVAVRGEVCSVQTDGYVKIGYSGNISDMGLKGLVSDGDGNVKVATVDESMRAYSIMDIDKENKKIGIIM